MRSAACALVVAAAFSIALSTVTLSSAKARAAWAEAALQAPTTSTTSTTDLYLGNTLYGCTYEVRALESRPLSALGIGFDPSWGQLDNECGPAVGDGRTVEHDFFTADVEFAQPFDGPGAVVACGGEAIWEKGDPLPAPVDFTSVRVWATYAVDPTGAYVRPPRVCVTNLQCEDVRGQLEWKSDPLCGDADYDGTLAASDALAALRTAVGTGTCIPVETTCDTNADGNVTAADALAVLRTAVGNVEDLTCPPPCLPGTIGPPGVDHLFDIQLVLADVEQRDVTFTIDYTNAPGGFVGSGTVLESGGLLCRTLEFPGAQDLHDDDQGHLTGRMVQSLTSNDPHPFAGCYFRAVGDGYPAASDFVISTQGPSGPLPADVIRIGSIRPL